jgi:phosphatidylinositol 4-kinase type 2
METDASDFLRKHPWPGRAIADTFDDDPHRRGGLAKRVGAALSVLCGRDGEEEEERVLYDASDAGAPRGFYWTEALQASFRAELEKCVCAREGGRGVVADGRARLVILDYLMRNTDRGADNYMIKCCDEAHDAGAPAPTPAPQMAELRPAMPSTSRMDPATAQPTPGRRPHIHIAAIDNSLSFPHEHPKGWRSYTYGWLFLPVSVIGRPFSEDTRNHFLPLRKLA